MTQRLNPNIAIALDMDLPDEIAVEESAPMVIVEPHEIVTVPNEDLPDMTDLEVKVVQGEKQLEQIITKGMGMFTELYDELSGIDPKYRNRHSARVILRHNSRRGASRTARMVRRIPSSGVLQQRKRMRNGSGRPLGREPLDDHLRAA